MNVPPFLILLGFIVICAFVVVLTALVLRLTCFPTDTRLFRLMLLGLGCVAFIKLVLSPMMLYAARALGSVLGPDSSQGPSTIDPSVVLIKAAVITFFAYGAGFWALSIASPRTADAKPRPSDALIVPDRARPTGGQVFGYTALAGLLWYLSYAIITQGGFMGGGLVFAQVFNPAEAPIVIGTIAALATAVWAFLSVFAIARDQALRGGRPALVVTLFVVGLSAIAVYHGLWLALMLAAISIAPLDMSTTK